MVQIASTNGRAKADDIPIWVGNGAFSLAILFVPWSRHLKPNLFPFRRHPVGILTVNVESTMFRRVVANDLDKVDGEIPLPVCERIRVIVERHFEPCPLKPVNRSGHVGDLEDRFEPRDQPCTSNELKLAVPLAIQPGEVVVADRLVGVRRQSDPPIDRH